MKTYISQWPDGTISIVSAEDRADLFWKLDSEGYPACAKIFVVNGSYGDGVHITTKLTKKNGKHRIDFESGEHGHEIKKFPKSKKDNTLFYLEK